ncbi:MAG: terminase, partial [Pseudomonadota bacterium]|nr:terminase [Pseudomonadota bacterium]
HGVVMTALKSWSGKGDDIFVTTQAALDECIDGEYGLMYYDADGLGAGVRGDARVINERHAKQGIAAIKVDPFAGSAAVFEPEKEMVKGRKNKDFFSNLKAQSWWMLRMRFQNTFRAINDIEYDPEMIISIPSDLPERAQLMVELSQPTYTKNGSGKIVVDKQPDSAKSPNRADSVMICYSPLVRRPQAFATGGNRTF